MSLCHYISYVIPISAISLYQLYHYFSYVTISLCHCISYVSLSHLWCDYVSKPLFASPSCPSPTRDPPPPSPRDPSPSCPGCTASFCSAHIAPPGGPVRCFSQLAYCSPLSSPPTTSQEAIERRVQPLRLQPASPSLVFCLRATRRAT